MHIARNRAVFAPDGGGSAPMDGGAPGGGAPATPPDGGAPASFDWAGALGDKHTTYQPMLQTKGWKSPADVLTAYQNLESLSGRMITPPGQDAKPEDWNAVYDRLGRPQAPDGYTSIARPQDLPADFLPDEDLTAFRQAAHGAGLNEQQARAMFDWFAGRGQQQFTTAREADAKVEPELRGKWGAAYDGNLAVARRAAQAFGGEAIMDTLERNVGGAAMVEFFHKIGAAMGEDTLAGNGGAPTGGPATPQAAQQRIAALTSDAEFQKNLWDRAQPGHAEAKRQWEELHKKAYS